MPSVAPAGTTGLASGLIRPVAAPPLMLAIRSAPTALRRIMPAKLRVGRSASSTGPLGWRVTLRPAPAPIPTLPPGVEVDAPVEGGAEKMRIEGGVALALAFELPLAGETLLPRPLRNASEEGYLGPAPGITAADAGVAVPLEAADAAAVAVAAAGRKTVAPAFMMDFTSSVAACREAAADSALSAFSAGVAAVGLPEPD
jgi:hypothetical protein